MKKNYFLIIFSLLIMMVSLVSCQYKGKTIISLKYTCVDFFGGHSKEYCLDFQQNQYLFKEYWPSEENDKEYILKNTFTEEEEKEFIDGIYSKGLLSIKEVYERKNISDGSGWYLVIEFIDESKKVSRGSNDGPYDTFKKCSPYFEKLCLERVL